MRGADRNQFGGRIEMAERAADRAAVARLAMADVHDGLMQQRAFRLDEVGEFEVALARHGADLERATGLFDAGHAFDLVKAKCPLLHQAIMHIGHRQTRNRGTIGGSLCHLDPAAELVSVAAAHDATVVVAGQNGTREIAFKDFPAGYLTPAIELNEIVTAIRIPLWPAGHKAAFVEFSRRHGDFAIVSAAALLQIEGGKIARASVTVGGVAVAPVRASDVEQAITGQAPTSDLFAKACESCRSIDAMADIHASADYRQHLAAVLSRRALEKAAVLADNAPWNLAH